MAKRHCPGQRCCHRASSTLGEDKGSARSYRQRRGNALYQDDVVDQLTHTGKGKSGAVVKMINGTGSIIAVKYRLEAAKYRAEAARLRDELAQIESQN
jgi:hypothetical protein